MVDEDLHLTDQEPPDHCQKTKPKPRGWTHSSLRPILLSVRVITTPCLRRPYDPREKSKCPPSASMAPARNKAGISASSAKPSDPPLEYLLHGVPHQAARHQSGISPLRGMWTLAGKRTSPRVDYGAPANESALKLAVASESNATAISSFEIKSQSPISIVAEEDCSHFPSASPSSRCSAFWAKTGVSIEIAK